MKVKKKVTAYFNGVRVKVEPIDMDAYRQRSLREAAEAQRRRAPRIAVVGGAGVQRGPLSPPER